MKTLEEINNKYERINELIHELVVDNEIYRKEEIAKINMVEPRTLVCKTEGCKGGEHGYLEDGYCRRCIEQSGKLKQRITKLNIEEVQMLKRFMECASTQNMKNICGEEYTTLARELIKRLVTE